MEREKGIKQLDHTSEWKWPNGDSIPLAELALSPEEISEQYGIQFGTETDDLDEMDFALIELAEGVPAVLYRYRNYLDESPGTLVRVDAQSDVKQTQGIVKDVFRLEDNQFAWKRDKDVPPPPIEVSHQTSS